LNTLVGAVPGALPPVIGWTAGGGTLGPEVGVLFFVLFLWQVPHFLAIAWIYRQDYARAGLRMLSVVDDTGVMTARQMVLYAMALIPVSLSPVMLGQAGWLFAAAALTLGMSFLWTTLAFMREASMAAARRVLHASLIYLPAVFALLLLQGVMAPGLIP
jgi:protoheme IX farnesyltransferase